MAETADCLSPISWDLITRVYEGREALHKNDISHRNEKVQEQHDLV